MNEATPSPLGNVITIDDERIKNHLDRVVRGSVEEALSKLRRLVLILRRTFFKSTASMLREARSSERGSVGPRFCRFSANLSRCIIGIEACATAHYWASELLAIGHEVKRGKSDGADAEAICEAVMRPTMRFVPVKSAEQHSALMLHRSRDLLIRQRTMLANGLRSHFAELEIFVAQGFRNLSKLIEIVFDETDNRLPSLAPHALGVLVAQIQDIQARIKDLERALLAWHQKNQTSRRLETIPGIGFITATAIAEQ